MSYHPLADTACGYIGPGGYAVSSTLVDKYDQSDDLQVQSVPRFDEVVLSALS